MRSLLVAVLFPAFLGAAPDALQIVRPVISRTDDGVNEPKGSEHTGGDVLYFSCRVANYGKSADQQVKLAYAVEVFDPHGVPLMEPVKSEIAEEVSAEDKEWLPRIAAEIALPGAAPPGAYKIVVKVDDAVAHTTASLDVPFQVRGRVVPPTGKLTVQNLHCYSGEEDTKPLDNPVYKAGDSLWVRFDVTGFKTGEKNQVDVSYVFSVLAADGTVMWTAPEPVVDQGDSFYPKPFLSGAFSINVQSSVKPGEYAIGVKVTDAVGKQTISAKQPFTVQ